MRKYRYYCVIGENGYGFSEHWIDIENRAETFIDPWYKGFQDIDSAYNWLKKQVTYRAQLSKEGIVSKQVLLNKKFIYVGELPDFEERSVFNQLLPERIEDDSSNLMYEMDVHEVFALFEKWFKKNYRGKVSISKFTDEEREELFVQFQNWYCSKSRGMC